MMTVDERASYQNYSEEIIRQAAEIMPNLPYGVRADLDFNKCGKIQLLAVRIFKDIVEDVEKMKQSLDIKYPYEIIVTTIAEVRLIYGDGVNGVLWNYGDKLHYTPLKKKKNNE